MLAAAGGSSAHIMYGTAPVCRHLFSFFSFSSYLFLIFPPIFQFFPLIFDWISHIMYGTAPVYRHRSCLTAPFPHFFPFSNFSSVFPFFFFLFLYFFLIFNWISHIMYGPALVYRHLFLISTFSNFLKSFPSNFV